MGSRYHGKLARGVCVVDTGAIWVELERKSVPRSLDLLLRRVALHLKRLVQRDRELAHTQQAYENLMTRAVVRGESVCPTPHSCEKHLLGHREPTHIWERQVAFARYEDAWLSSDETYIAIVASQPHSQL